MRNLRDTLISLNVDMTKLDEIMKTVEAKEMYKVYILYEFLDWEDSIEDERFVLYTEDEYLANSYFDLLKEVEDAFSSRYDELSAKCFYSARLEKVSLIHPAIR